MTSLAVLFYLQFILLISQTSNFFYFTNFRNLFTLSALLAGIGMKPSVSSCSYRSWSGKRRRRIGRETFCQFLPTLDSILIIIVSIEQSVANRQDILRDVLMRHAAFYLHNLCDDSLFGLGQRWLLPFAARRLPASASVSYQFCIMASVVVR